MPIYPALALLLGCSMARPNTWTRAGSLVVAAIGALAAIAIVFIYAQVWNLPTPGDISNALRTQDFEAYTLSLGHMGDLTLKSFAYLRAPLLMAGLAFLGLALTGSRLRGTTLYLGLAASMVLFLNAARVAMVTFDPYLASRPLAEALRQTPDGTLIVDNQYYTFSSVFFYAGDRASRPGRRALLLNGRVTNLEYGSWAPGAPDVFIDDSKLSELWKRQERYYLLIEGPQLERVERIVGKDSLHEVRAAGGKYLLTNHANQR
jgi:hypothetical protein